MFPTHSEIVVSGVSRLSITLSSAKATTNSNLIASDVARGLSFTGNVALSTSNKT